MVSLAFLNIGFSQVDAALFVNREIVGTFFVLTGYHKLFNRERHAALVETLRACGIPFIGFNQWFVPLVEFFAGLGVVVGLLAPLAALGMIAILIVALRTDGARRIREYQPVDAGDFVCDVLYLQELLFLVMAFIVAIAGPGRWSLYVLLPLLGW